MSIKRINEFPEGSGSLSNDDVFLFMDDPSGGGTTKKISLSQIADAIGGGGSSGNPFDQDLNTTNFPSFSGVSLSNGTTLAQGTFDNSTGGQNGISLNCYVGYELNWQGGHLKCTQDNGSTAANIILDSALQFSDNVIVCSSTDDLAIKYSIAKTLTPGDSALSATNRATLIIMPGNYTVSSPLAIDTDYVDVIGLGSIKLERGAIPAVNLSGGINVTASNVRVKGISVGTDNFTIVGASDQIFEDCTGGDYSFAGGYSLDENENAVGGVASGSFINCIGGNSSFAGDTSYGGTASGFFINCVGGNASFACNGYASGIFINCSSGNMSFGAAESGTANGTFVNCVGGDGCFGSAGGGPASGSFTDCVSGNYSFGGYGTANGTFKDCVGGDDSFGGNGGTASGSFTNCSGGLYSFSGYGGTASGNFINCSGGEASFGGGQITGEGSTGNGIASGSFKYCSGGYGAFGGLGGTASGFFLECISNENSFGSYGGVASGTFLKCVMKFLYEAGTFQTLSSGGKYRLCIDGNFNVINADYVAP